MLKYYFVTDFYMIQTEVEKSLEGALQDLGMPLGKRKTFDDFILEKPDIPEPDELDYESLSKGEKLLYLIFSGRQTTPLFERVSVMKGGFFVKYLITFDGLVEFDLFPEKRIDDLISSKGYLFEAVEVYSQPKERRDAAEEPEIIFHFTLEPDGKVMYDSDDKYEIFKNWHNKIKEEVDNGKITGRDIVPTIIGFLERRIKN